MKKESRRNLLALALNLATVVLVALSVLAFFMPVGIIAGAGNMTVGGTRCFRYFTIDSNILCALGSLLLLPYQVKSLAGGKNAVPRWAFLLRFVGTVAVTVTMTVVLFFLGPTTGYGPMFEGACLELHLICPLLAILSFVLCERGLWLTKTRCLWGIAPTVIYGTVYLVNVIALGTWEDFYGFNIGGFWYISYLVMPAVTYAIALALGALHNRAERAGSGETASTGEKR